MPSLPTSLRASLSASAASPERGQAVLSALSGLGPTRRLRRGIWALVAATFVLALTGVLIGSLLAGISRADRAISEADRGMAALDALHQLQRAVTEAEASTAPGADPAAHARAVQQTRALLDNITALEAIPPRPGAPAMPPSDAMTEVRDIVRTWLESPAPGRLLGQGAEPTRRIALMHAIAAASTAERLRVQSRLAEQANWRRGQYVLALTIALISTLLLIAAITIGLRHLGQQEATDRALRRAHDAAVAANRAKSRFLAAASHDLRQPLHALNLFASALERRITDEDARRLLEGLRNASASMQRMFHSLLDISKLDAGAVRPEPVDFPLFDLLDSLKLEFSTLAAEKHLEFAVTCASEIVHSDPPLLESVLRNLLSNAIRYTQRGAVQVNCRRMQERVIVDVRDTGPGIPPDKLETVFEEFQRLEGSAHVVQGLGLGLAIVKRTCELLGIQLGLRSTLGSGSVFTLAIPIGRHAVLAAEPAELVAEPEFAGKTVLVVDDDPMVLRALSQELRDWGMLVTAASGPAEVLAALEQPGAPVPDLAIVDRNLNSGFTGPELLDHLAARYHMAIPAVVLNGATSAEVLEELRETGYPYLIKPADPKRLRAMLAELLAGRDPVDKAAVS